MFHLKLKKSRSYTGYGVTVTATAPDVRIEDEAVAEALEASGYFDLCPDGTPDAAPPAPPSGTITAIDTMNITQLRAYAKKLGLDISEAAPSGSSVEEVREAVREAMAEGGDDPTGQFASGGGAEGEE